MPHFILHCSAEILQTASAQTIMEAVYREAEASGLFASGDIKVRIQPFEHYQLGEGKTSFLHVFAHIMQGRTTEQKAALSKSIVQSLNVLLPAFPSSP